MMDCADLDRDGRLDYMEFTHRFHSPAEEIGGDTAWDSVMQHTPAQLKTLGPC